MLEKLIEAISHMEAAKLILVGLREADHTALAARALSIAITELETAQLWAANAKQD